MNQSNKKYSRYKLKDQGTFGGPSSYIVNGFDGILNNRGIEGNISFVSQPRYLETVIEISQGDGITFSCVQQSTRGRLRPDQGARPRGLDK